MIVNVIYFKNNKNIKFKEKNVGELSFNYKTGKYFHEDFIKELFYSNKDITINHVVYEENKEYINPIIYCEDLGKYNYVFEKFNKKPFMIIHLLDENLNHDISIYNHKNCIHIFREYIRPKISDEIKKKITYIPLAYKSDLKLNNTKKIKDRKYVWSFCGHIQKNNRYKFINKLKKIKPYFLSESDRTWQFKLNEDSYSKIMEDTIFSPCLIGNTNIDTQRLIESLEFGCIPIVNKYYIFPLSKIRYWGFNYNNFVYYDNLFGKNPIPYVSNHHLSKQKFDIKNLSYHFHSIFYEKIKNIRNTEDLQLLQNKIINWYQNYKTQLKNNIKFILLNNFTN